MTEDKKVFNAKTHREMKQFKHIRLDKMQVTLIFNEGRRTKDVEKLYSMLFLTPKELKEIPIANKYLISKDGRIFSKTTTGLEMSHYIDKDGYKRIAIVCNDGVRKKHYVHRLVALTYIPNIDNLPLVNHKDENKQNCYVDNLEWCTVQYNQLYSKSWLKRKRDDIGRFV